MHFIQNKKYIFQKYWLYLHSHQQSMKLCLPNILNDIGQYSFKFLPV